MILAVLLALKMLTLTFNYVSCSIIFIMIDGVYSASQTNAFQTHEMQDRHYFERKLMNKI